MIYRTLHPGIPLYLLSRTSLIRLLVLLTVALVGTVLLTASHAATPIVSLEPEAGTLGVGATTIADSNASGGSAVRFRGGVRNINAKGVGISGNFTSLTAAQQDAEFADLQSLGITWIRTDIAWDYIQPTQASAYQWTAYDNIVAKAQAHGIQVDGILDFTTSWNRTAGCTYDLCPPADVAAYVAFSKAAVSHFGNKLGAVEIWNEPNISVFWGGATPSAATYTSMLKQAYAGIKSVDPGMLVISAGLSPSNTTSASQIQAVDYTSSMYANGLKGSYDVFGYHPYSYPTPPSQYYSYSGWSMLNDTPTSIRSVMTANGDAAKSVWLTEVGAPTDGPGPLVTCAQAAAKTYPSGNVHVDQCLQAQIISEAVTKAKAYPWAGVTFIYTYQDLGTATTTNENFFGLVNTTGAHKPSYDALKTAIQQ